MVVNVNAYEGLSRLQLVPKQSCPFFQLSKFGFGIFMHEIDKNFTEFINPRGAGEDWTMPCSTQF